MLSKIEKQQIKVLMQDPRWDTLERLVVEYCNQLALDPAIRDSEWETLKATISKEAKIEGIRKFIQECYNQAQQSNV